MAYEDFTTYTEVDPNSKLTVAANVITATALPRNSSNYVYKDMGIDHFSGDFTHLVDCIFTSYVTVGIMVNWILANAIGDLYAILNSLSPKNCLSVNCYDDGATRAITLRECDAGTGYISNYYYALTPSIRYLKLVRDESVTTYGTIYMYSYSDSARTDLLNTQSIALHTSKKDYRYVYGMASYSDGLSYTYTGRTENLDLQEAVTGKPYYYFMQQ